MGNERSSNSNLFNFHADSASSNRTMNRRKPKLFLPPQTKRFAQLHQVAPIVRLAIPEATRPGAGEIVFGRKQKHPPTSAKHSRQLAQTLGRIGHMFQHISTRNAVERIASERQRSDIGD